MAEVAGRERPSAALQGLARRLEARGDRDGARAACELARSLVAWEADVVRAAVGALAAHHDIRNALTGVMGNAQLLLMGPAADLPGVRRRLESLTREAERIRDLAETLGRARLELGERLDGRPSPAHPGAGVEAA